MPNYAQINVQFSILGISTNLDSLSFGELLEPPSITQASLLISTFGKLVAAPITLYVFAFVVLGN